jgi:hypothetical protein
MVLDEDEADGCGGASCTDHQDAARKRSAGKSLGSYVHQLSEAPRIEHQYLRQHVDVNVLTLEGAK